MRRQASQPNKGFTLIEVLVALSIFTTVMVTAVAALLAMVAANSKAQNMNTAMTNLSFVLDSMTREIRTGTDYDCTTDDVTTPSGIASGLSTNEGGTNDCTHNGGLDNRMGLSFREGGTSLTQGLCDDPNGDNSRRIAYRYNENDLSIERRLCNGSWDRMTPPDVEIQHLQFSVTGSSRGGEAPLVTIYLTGNVQGFDNTSDTFVLQTTVAQHLIDI